MSKLFINHESIIGFIVAVNVAVAVWNPTCAENKSIVNPIRNPNIITNHFGKLLGNKIINHMYNIGSMYPKILILFNSNICTKAINKNFKSVEKIVLLICNAVF